MDGLIPYGRREAFLSRVTEFQLNRIHRLERMDESRYLCTNS